MAESMQIASSNNIADGEQWSLDTMIVVPTSDIYVSYVDDVAIILNLDSGEYHTLTPVGQFIWKLLTPKNSLGNILSTMCSHYGVPESTAREDLIDLVIQLRKAELVHLGKL